MYYERISFFFLIQDSVLVSKEFLPAANISRRHREKFFKSFSNTSEFKSEHLSWTILLESDFANMEPVKPSIGISSVSSNNVGITQVDIFLRKSILSS